MESKDEEEMMDEMTASDVGLDEQVMEEEVPGEGEETEEIAEDVKDEEEPKTEAEKPAEEADSSVKNAEPDDEESKLEEREKFIMDIKTAPAEIESTDKKMDTSLLHLSESSSGSREGLSEAPEIIQLEIREFEEDGIAPDDEDMTQKKKVQEEQKAEEAKESMKEEKELDEDEEDFERGPAVAAVEEDREEFAEEEEDIEDERVNESIIDLLYEMDEEFNPELEYVDTREGDDEWEEPVYDFEDYISEPYLSDKSTLEKNVLEFNYSLGYDSCRRYNLCVADEDTVIYLSGNYIHIYNIEKDHFQYIRSSSGVGLGHISKHPFEPIFAVGERGDNPLIILFTYPDLKIIRVLKGGTERFYNYIYFSPNGEWLISQGGEPDNSLAIWNWKFERMVIMQKCLGREVWRAETNPFIVGGITTSGVSHIKFWTMNETFTGLKLRGLSGKFGTNEFCDISTFCALPLNMVLSPNSSKNVYVWEGEEIRMEIKRRNNLPLHEDDITYLEFKQQFDEIFTVGLEGKYKVWDYSRIEYGKKSELYELELQPTFQRRIQDEMGLAQPMDFQRKSPNNPNSELYYMQDRRGSIWLVEMAVKNNLAPSQRVFLGHQSPIGDIAPSPADYYLASVGAEGKLHVYNMKKKKLIMVKYFGIGGSALLWLPLVADSTATVLLVGFTDGTLRVVILSIRARELSPKEESTNYINVIQALKPHSNAITEITFNPHRPEMPMVVTGSLDCRIFIYWLKPRKEYVKLEPFAFVAVPDPIHYMTWNKEFEAILTTSEVGTIVEVAFPENIPQPPSNTYEISVPKRISRFTSVKSEILRNIVVERNIQRKLRRKEKREKKRQAELDRETKRTGKKKAVVTQKRVVKHDKVRRTGVEESAFDYEGARGERDSEDSGEESVGRQPNRRILTRFDDFSDQVRESDEEMLQNLDAAEEPEGGQEGAELEPTDATLKNLSESRVKIVAVGGEGVEEAEEEPEAGSVEEDEQEEQLDDDEESFEDEYGEISEDEDLPPLYEPPHPSPVFFANYIDKDSVWVSVGGYDVGYLYEYKLGQHKPYKSTLLEDDRTIDMNCSLQLLNGEFLIFGLGNGVIKFIKTNPEDFTDFSDYWKFAMHDNLNGKIRKMYATYDTRFLYSVGNDSNIFFYRVNLPETKFPDKKNLPQLLPPPIKLKIDGYISPDMFSLEDAKLAALLEKRKKMGGSRKVILKKKIEELTTRFKILIELNQGLPESQRLPASFFIIDQDFEKKFRKTITEKKLKLTRHLEMEYWKAKLLRDKLFNYFIKPVKTFKIYVMAINLFTKITTFYQPKLSLSFLEAEREAEAMMIDILKKGRDKYKQPLIATKELKCNTKFKKSKLEVRPLIKGQEDIVELLGKEQKALFTRLSMRRQRRKLLQNILTLFLEEKEMKKKQFLENLEARKAASKDLNSMTYTLKTDPNFKLNSLRRISKEKKFYQLVAAKRKIHDYTSHFNSQVLRLRNMKSKAVALYKSLVFEAIALNTEFKDVPLLPPPKRIIIYEMLEFPEVNYMDDPPVFPHEEDVMTRPYRDHLFSQLYEINKTFPIQNDLRTEEKIINKLEKSEKIDIRKSVLQKIYNKYGFHTLWEQELMGERKQYLINEYVKKVQILNDMIEEFDNEVGNLHMMRVEYAIKIYYLKTFFYKYYEELQIIRSHQLVEKEITNKMEVFFIQKHIFILRINIRKIRINKCLDDIKICNKNYDKITTNFYNLITNVTLAHKRHLMRIFKKKWKPEKLDGGDESEESSDEEEEEEDEDEEEEEEIDIEDLMNADFVPMDENIRPEGLSKEVFDKTFIYREERHSEEKKIYEKKLEMQHYKDQIDHLRKTLLTIEVLIAMFQVKMRIVLQEKHKALSSVRTVVVLDASQMQHYDTEKKAFSTVKDSVLFPLYTLKNLQAQKRELMEDIMSVQLKKQEIVKHVKRLDLDIRYLRQRLKGIKEQISREKIVKFGVPVNLERLEETILLKIIKEFKYDAFPFHLKFHTDIVKLQKELSQAEKTTGDHIKLNTYEQLKMGALMEQKRVYQEVLKKVRSRKNVQYLSIEEINISIDELKLMLKIQAAMKQFLLEEINDMKYKNRASNLEKQHINLRDQMAEKIMQEEIDEECDEEYDSFEENENEDLQIISKISKQKSSKPQEDGNEPAAGDVLDSPVDLTTDEEDGNEEEFSAKEEGEKETEIFTALEEVLAEHLPEDQ